MRIGTAFFGGHLVPLRRFRVVLRDALAEEIQRAEAFNCFGYTRIGRLLLPLGGLVAVGGQTFAVFT